MSTSLKITLLVVCIFLITNPVCAQMLNLPYTQNKVDRPIGFGLLYNEDIFSEQYLRITEEMYRATNSEKKTNPNFIDYINFRNYTPPLEVSIMKDDRKVLRAVWENFFGVDIFYPYFKAKEIEDWATEKASIKVFKLKGTPKFGSNKFRYTFKVKF